MYDYVYFNKFNEKKGLKPKYYKMEMMLQAYDNT